MRTTITLDDDVAAAVQEISRTSGKRLGQVVSELVRRGLRGPAVQPPGFPVFRVPVDAPVIPADRARRLLEEDTL